MVNDHKKRIRYYNLGWPGNVHDERVYRNTGLAKWPSEFFSTGQIMLFDSAVTPRVNVVSLYKKGVGAELPVRQAQFNSIHAGPRVTSEHTIGIFKARFCFARQIRMKITADANSFAKVMNCIKACIILHNMLIGWDEQEFAYKDNEDNTNMQTTQVGGNVQLPNGQINGREATTGIERRQQLYDKLFNEGVFDTVTVKRRKKKT